MDLEFILLKWSKSERERQLPYDIMYLESKIWHRRAETDLLTREQTCWYWGEKNWEFGISRCNPLYVEWIYNTVLLYSTRNYIQYTVINHNGNEGEKEKNI